jgi:hypothetical protein
MIGFGANRLSRAKECAPEAVIEAAYAASQTCGMRAWGSKVLGCHTALSSFWFRAPTETPPISYVCRSR